MFAWIKIKLDVVKVPFAFSNFILIAAELWDYLLEVRGVGWGIVLTSHCNFKTRVNVPHVNIYHIESVLGHRRRTTT